MKRKSLAWMLVSTCVLLVALVSKANGIPTAAVRVERLDGTSPVPPPIPMGPHAFDGTSPVPKPIPMGPHTFDGTSPVPKPIPMGPHTFDGTSPVPKPIPMGPGPKLN